ncbi:integrase catalytic domain-containing protein [Rubidibacter lacunae]|uniref:integrase catalytic domain-containing protein n=1 Tax=Rubidibacter lacunae TaxID=582514 RepID=UPI0003F4E9AB|nr:DDE-type integrase/transposase/recombinase [Rubidibacter lacunae]
MSPAPNQVWTWDITKLALSQKGVYLSLYAIVDLFSRFVLAWMLSRKENSALSQQLMCEAMARHPHATDARTIHQDRGAPMIARNFLEVISDLGGDRQSQPPESEQRQPIQ